MFCALAEFEADLLAERIRAGLAAAREAGRLGGRRPALTEQQARAATQLLASEEHTGTEVAEIFGVGRSTLHRAIAALDSGAA